MINMLHNFSLLLLLAVVAKMALPMSVDIPNLVDISTSIAPTGDDMVVHETNSAIHTKNETSANMVDYSGASEGQADDVTMTKIASPNSGSAFNLRSVSIGSSREVSVDGRARFMLRVVSTPDLSLQEKWRRLARNRKNNELVMKKIVEEGAKLGIPQQDFECLNLLLQTQAGVCNNKAPNDFSNSDLLIATGKLVRCLDAIVKGKPVNETEEMDRLVYSFGSIYVQNADQQDWVELVKSHEHKSDTQRFLEYNRKMGHERGRKYLSSEYADLFEGKIWDNEIRKKMGKELLDLKPSRLSFYIDQSTKIGDKFSSRLEEKFQKRKADITTELCYAFSELPKMSWRTGEIFFATKAFDVDKLLQGFNNREVSQDIMEDLINAATSGLYNKELPKIIAPACPLVANQKPLARMEERWDLCKTLKERLLDLVKDIPDVLKMDVGSNSRIQFLRTISTEVYILQKMVERVKNNSSGVVSSDLDYVLASISPKWIEENKPANYKRVKKILQSVPGVSQQLTQTYDEFNTLVVDKRYELRNRLIDAANHLKQGGPLGNIVESKVVEDIQLALNVPFGRIEKLQALESRVNAISSTNNLNGNLRRAANITSAILRKYISEELAVAPLIHTNFNVLECKWNSVKVDKSNNGLLKAYFQAFINTMKVDVDDFSHNRYFTTRRAHSVAVFLRLLKADERFKEFGSSLKQEFETRKYGWQTFASTLEEQVKKFDTT